MLGEKIGVSMPIKHEIITGHGGARFLTPEGVLYTAYTRWSENSNYNLYRTPDWGNTWEEVYEFNEYISNVHCWGDTILVTLHTGRVMHSTDGGSTFTQVHSTGANARPDLSFFVYDNLVLLGRYGYGGTTTWLSRDQGATWEGVFESPIQGDGVHTHRPAYDPYGGLLWIATGDADDAQRIYWSSDWGKTWRTLHHRDSRYRVTNILPMPDCVLFGSDEDFEHSVYRWHREKDGRAPKDAEPEKAWFGERFFYQPAPGEQMTWATTPAITYGKDARAYFGFVQPEANIQVPSIVYATDGHDFWPVWVEDKIPSLANDGATGFVGIWLVTGPDSEGNIAALLRSDYNGESEHILKIAQVSL